METTADRRVFIAKELRQLAQLAEMLADELDDPDADLLEVLAEADASFGGLRSSIVHHVGRLAHDYGASYRQLGDALGISQQAAWERFAAPGDQGGD